MNSNSIKKPNYSNIELAIENDQSFNFIGRIHFLQHIFFVSLIVFFIWYLQYEITDILTNLHIMGYTFSLIGIILISFLVGIFFWAIIRYYFNIYRRNITINSKEIQFRIKGKTKECLEWKDILNISKAYSRFYKITIDKDEKWNLIIVKPKLGEVFKINPRVLKNKDFSQKYIKEIVFFILTHYYHEQVD